MAGSSVAKRVFFEAILIRLVVAILFSSLGYLGSGGDAWLYFTASEIYKNASLDVSQAILILKESELASTENFYNLLSIFQDLEDPLPDTTSVLIILQALLLLISESILSLKLFNVILSSTSISYLVSKRNLKPIEAKLFIYNPVSIYYAGCNLKESISESLIIFLIAISLSNGAFLKRVLLYSLLFCLRSSYLIVILVIEILPFFRKVSLTLACLIPLAIFPFLTKFQWSVMDTQTAGPLYSVVYSNSFTRGVIGPLVGILHPFPMVINLNDSWIDVIYNCLYCIYYWFLVVMTARLSIFRRRRVSLYTKSFFILKILVGFYVIGSMVTSRFSAPFLPLLIFGYIEMKYQYRNSNLVKATDGILDKPSH